MRFLDSCLVLVVLVAACSTSSSTVGFDSGQDTAAEVATGDASVADLVSPPDERTGEIGNDIYELLPLEIFEETTGPGCDAGEGCFLDPCESNDDCLSGWCVGHMGEDVCTLQCQSECPPGWSCQQVPGTVPDVVWICVSDHANLCLPCSAPADCKGAAGVDNACLDYGEEGSFCGGKCSDDEDCPWGFSCTDAATVDGVELKQCVADAGVCPCTKKSVELGLLTPCELKNEFGSCPGKRVCTDEGLSDCDAVAPAAETCNGLDDDCDGEIDEPNIADGEYVGLCDDDNDCTDDGCSGTEGCTNVAVDEGECVDGDSCTVGDHCEAGACVGSQVDCDDSNPCTDDACSGLGGCLYTNNEADCDDADPCTVADECSEGVCAGVAVNCDCQVDGDCQELEDGDKCNGTLVCNTSALPYQCVVDADTVVTCPEPDAGPNAFCLESLCDPENGGCSILPANDGFPCNDADPCTVGDHCAAGVCGGGVAPNCNDGNPCTDDGCGEEGCVHTPNAALCSDGDVCTTGDTCANGQCVAGPDLDCNDSNPCTVDGCDAQVGCIYEFAAAPCDDGNQCTPVDTCLNGQCQGSGELDCDDDNVCTTDSCNPAAGCTHTIHAGPCDDGNPCTINDGCVNGTCSPGKLVDCNDDNPCTDDACGPDGICLHVANAAVCDDDNKCTLGDSCDGGKCGYAGLLNCNDDSICTDDSCDPAQGCVHLLNSSPCDDNDLCTTGDHCNLGECVGGAALTCDDGNSCTDDACAPGAGCQFVANSAPCDDGSACTLGDKCKAGWCSGGEPLGCGDENPCTDDSCDPAVGCVNVNNAAPCSDGSACTVGDVCTNGSCVPGESPDCDDDNICTDDSCDPAVGCVNANNAVFCDDDDPCTELDVCFKGDCVGSGELACSDGDKCTTDVCTPGIGCQYPAITPCCGNGQKEGNEECDDGNENNGDGCKNDCTVQTITRTVPGFSGALGPDLSGSGWSQCAGTASFGTTGKQFYPLCEGHQQIRFACSTDNNESAEYTSPAFTLAGKSLLDNQCDNWVGASNSIYGSDYILSVDPSNPGCGNYNVNYKMYVHFAGQWGCNNVPNTHNKGRMFAYVKD